MSIDVVNNLPATGPTLVPSGSTTFYKYEPFSYTFTGGTGFTVSGTLTGYCTGVGTDTLVFRQSTLGFQTTSAFGGETLTVTSSLGTLSYLIFILGGRFIVSPPLASIVLYQNEPISNTLTLLGYSSYSNITFTSQTRLCNTTYTVPTLPSTLLTLTNPSLDGSNFVLSGRCSIISASSNYFFIGSNSSNNYSVTKEFGIQVTNERIVMIPTVTNYALTLDTAISTPITFSVFKPITAVAPPVFSSTNLPPGLSLTSNIDSVSIIGTPIYPTSGITSYTTILRVSAIGLGPLTTTSSISFSYTSSLLFTAPTSNLTFYSNVPNQVQCTAVVFPVSAPVTYSSLSLPSGFSLSPTGLLSGTLTSTPGPITVTATSGLLTPVNKILTISLSNVPISNTIVPSSSSNLNYIVGQTLSNTVILFTSDAYSPSSNFISSITSNGFPPGIVVSAPSNNSIQLSGTAVAETITRTGSISGTALTLTSSASLAIGTNLTGSGVTPGTVVVFGSGTSYLVSPSQTVTSTTITAFPTVTSGNLTITVNTIHGASSNVVIPYAFTADTFTFSTLTPSPFSWVQNKPIAPIQFSATTASGTPVVYFYGDTTLPSGLYVTPGGTLLGTPSDTTNSNIVSFNGFYATNGLSTFSPVDRYYYRVISDSILITSPTPVTVLDVPTPTTPVINAESLDTVLFTTSASHGYIIGDSVTLSGFTFSAAPLNGVQSVFSIPSSTSFLISSSVVIQPIDQNQVVSLGSSNTIVQSVSTPVVRFTTGTSHGLTPGSTATFVGLTDSAFSLNGVQSILSVPSLTTCLVPSTVTVSNTVQTATMAGIPAIPITAQSVSGFIPTGPMTFTSYSYGLTGTATSISGTIGTLTYPDDIILPEYHLVNATLTSSMVPTVFSLYNSNPQRINRFIFAVNDTDSTYSIYTDNTTLNFSSNLFSITSATSVNALQFSSQVSLTSTQSILANGTSTLTVFTSMIPTSYTTVQLPGYSIITSIYEAVLSSWVLFSTSSPISLLFASDATDGWTNNSLSGNVPSRTTYLNGYVLKYFNGVFLIGGRGLYPLVYASFSSVPTDETVLTLTSVQNQRIAEVYEISSSPSVVVACGVDDSVTIQYSLNGIQWNEASMTDGVTWPHSITKSVVYGGAIAKWLAIGTLKTNTSYSSVLYSTDGIVWTTAIVFSEELDCLQFDGSDWCILSGTNTSGFSIKRHDPLQSTMTIDTSWASQSISLPNSTRLISMPKPIFTITGSPTLTLYIGVTPNGPTFTSPTVTSVLLYQYVPMTPIVFSATSSFFLGPALQVTYFLDSTLPPGMFWNSLTGTLSGRSVQLGTYSVVIYAQSRAGVSKLTMTFIVARVPIQPTLTTAASHTSFIREKVIADAATSSVNNHVTPSEVGPFLLERPPAITTAPEICCDSTRTQA